MPESKLNEQKSPLHFRKLPLASIIITSYNYEKFLPRAIDSVLQQTYPVKEIIVVCKKHGFSIAHEDEQGGFIIKEYEQGLAGWLAEASDATDREEEKI